VSEPSDLDLDLGPEPEPLVAVAESFLDRFRRGERPSVAEYADRHPELADQIRDLFPALVEVERLNLHAAGSAVPERVGGYRILREIGRGGMGVVYEAVEEALGRRVALKVLPAHALLRPSLLERFDLEARAAARLHHPNIVPVLGVGDHDGLRYYAMQYIPGRGLDAVLDELRRLRTPDPDGPAPDASTPGRPSATVIARTLATGSWPRPPVASDDPARADAATAPAVGSGDSRVESARAVAAIGLQVAEALAYAHGRGVIHRDVKPSNLLLDDRGNAWVADFGLAKLDDAGGPTRTGDLVGTLRYMAPERFDGWSDARSDVYGLGATLYELLTLRPAFDAPAAGALIDRVRGTDPPRPRALDRRIPRDLETIVMKALAREPSARYQGAGAMAEDLRRFVADRPILSRRSTPAERLWRWHRRNRAVAGLLWALAVVVVGGLAGMTSLYVEADRRRRDAEASFHDAHTAVDTLLTQVVENPLFDRPGTEPLRKELLGSALSYYRWFAARRPADPTVPPNLARAYFKVGLAAEQLGDSAGALEGFERSLEIRRALHAASPADPERRLELAYSHHKAGDALGKLGRADEAVRHHDEACALLEALVQQGAQPLARPALVEALVCRGSLLARNGRAGDAVRSFERVVALCEAMVAERPTDERGIRSLGAALNNLGNLHGEAGRKAEAGAAYRRAIAVYEPFLEGHPADTPGRAGLGAVCINYGALLSDWPAEAEPLLRRGVDLYEAVVKDHPDVAVHRRFLAGALNNLAVTLNATGRRGEASSAWCRASEQYVALAHPSPTDRVEQAGALAMAHAVAPASPAGPSLADRAAVAVRRAIEADPRLAAKVERDPALAPIRVRPDVRAALARAASRGK
jgi:serine/threonine protein kinase/tetratricopeptide (TPR) repeat protein